MGHKHTGKDLKIGFELHGKDLFTLTETDFDIEKNEMIFAVEGFDAVGKSYFIKNSNLFQSFRLNVAEKRMNIDTITWTPSFKRIDYSNCFIPSLTFFQLFEKNLISFKKKQGIIVDRCLISSIIYDKLKNQVNINELNPSLNEFKDMVKDIYKKNNVFNIYINHKDKDTAQILFNNMLLKDNRNSYDQFGSFESYWEEYQMFDQEYKRLLDEICDNQWIEISLDIKE
jgi:hypothetical protein